MAKKDDPKNQNPENPTAAMPHDGGNIPALTSEAADHMKVDDSNAGPGPDVAEPRSASEDDGASGRVAKGMTRIVVTAARADPLEVRINGDEAKRIPLNTEVDVDEGTLQILDDAGATYNKV